MKIKEKLLSIMLIMCILIGMPTTVFAKETKANSISNEKLEETIGGIINWAKQGEDKLLNPEFLQMVGTTPGDWFPIGMGRYGYKDDYGAYLSAIEKNVTERYKESGNLHPVKATEWHRISLAVLAMGGDPTKMGVDAKGNPINLIADGSYNCIARRGVKGQGINGAIWSLISMDTLRYDVPEGAKFTREHIIKLVLEEQLADGGFALTGNIADPDITGMAVQALASYYDSDKVYTYKSKKIKNDQGSYIECSKTIKQVIDESLDLMGTKQNADGDYFSWGTENVESTVQMLVALSSIGIDCEKDQRFIKDGKTLIDGIMKYRNPKDGGFLHSFTYDPQNPSSRPDASNSMATEQTLYGLVSYFRVRNNMRSLYDFRPETNQNEFIIKGNDNNYNIAFNKDQLSYSLELPVEVEKFSFINIPMGAYDISNVKLNSEIKAVDGEKVQVEIKNRQNETKNYEISIKITGEAKVNDVINAINNLSEVIALEDEEKIKEVNEKYNSLMESDKKKVTNIEKLNSANQKLKQLKEELGNETFHKQRVILDKINKLPKDISLDDKKLVSQLTIDLIALEDFQEKKVNIEKLNVIMKKIEVIEAKVNKLDDRIFKEIQPMNITLKNKAVILDLLDEYEKLDEKDRKYVENYKDVLFAQKVIYELETNNILLSDVFQNIIGTDEIYTFEGKTSDGKNYTVTFKGLDITDPTIDFNTLISVTSKNDETIKDIAKDAVILNFSHEGKLPGKSNINIEVDLEDGKYFLYYFNEETNKPVLISEIDVKDGRAIFEIDHCSDYFISQDPRLESSVDEASNTIDLESKEVKSEKGEAPKTGDNSNVILLSLLFVCSGGLIFILKKKSILKI